MTIEVNGDGFEDHDCEHCVYYCRCDYESSSSNSSSRIVELQEDIRRLQQWVNDLQSGMYINCVYCGHRYGPSDEVPATMADVLKRHVAQCAAHPMSKLLAACQAAEHCIAELSPTQARVEIMQMLQAAIRNATATDS